MTTVARWQAVGLTDIGRQRQSNQDRFLLLNPLGCWIIADGMGGHAGGAVASRLAVEAIAESIKTSAHGHDSDTRVAREGALKLAIEAGHAAVRQAAGLDSSLTGMGTTVVVLRLYTVPRLQAVVAHVGDSRAYLCRHGALTQITADHSLVEDYQRRGLLSAEQARDHPLRHVLSRAVGPDPHVQPDCSTLDVTSGDRILLCTDGLTKMLSDHKITALLAASGPLIDVGQGLIHAANDRGGEDNTTIVLIQL